MSAPLVIALMFPPVPEQAVADALAAIDPRVEVVWAPYIESADLRSAKGRNAGRDPGGFDRPDLDDAARTALGRSHAVVGIDLPSELIDLAPTLRWVQAVTAGSDHLDLETLGAAGVTVTHAGGIAAASISEFVFARILQHAKHLRTLEAQQAEHTWEVRFGTEIAGRSIGIVGLGSIGRAIARRARAFEMTVLASRASARPGDTDPDVDELFPSDDLDAMIARVDHLVLALPATPDSVGLMDARRLALMRPGSMLINIARGVHVVEADLIAALESGHLGAAALDVTHTEPLPADDPLWDAPNLYLSPHTSASLDRYQEQVVALTAENARRLLDSEPLRNVVI